VGGLISGTLEVMAEQSTARGVRGVVLAAAPLAAALGAEAMREGGNAYDGAVTAALAETVLLPPKCGLAGDLVALRIGAGDDQPEALVAIGGAGRRLAGEVSTRHELPTTGPLSVGVPAAPAGYDALAKEGRLPLRRLAAPAVSLARDGFVWSSICEALAWESHDLIRTHNPGGTRYYPGNAPLQAGEIVRLPGLADLLEQFAVSGAGVFQGAAGRVVAGYVQSKGGVLETDDFAFGRAGWEAAVEGGAAGRRVWTTPAPTHGPSLIDALANAQPGDAPGAVWDRVLAAMATRGEILADPSGTSMVSSADSDGNAVVIIHSNSFPRFGSGLVVPEFDLILSNRAGRGFVADPEHRNYPAPGRRPATTLHTWAVSDLDGTPWMLGGTPGGENQMPWNAQTLSQVINGESRPGFLVASPRWEWLNGNGVKIEEGFEPDQETSLVDRAARVEQTPRWGLRSAHQVVMRPIAGKAIVGAVDPRTGGGGVAI
jgi:gamma-glutamyltranspeptidase/glutathione hydrolase